MKSLILQVLLPIYHILKEGGSICFTSWSAKLAVRLDNGVALNCEFLLHNGAAADISTFEKVVWCGVAHNRTPWKVEMHYKQLPVDAVRFPLTKMLLEQEGEYMRIAWVVPNLLRIGDGDEIVEAGARAKWEEIQSSFLEELGFFNPAEVQDNLQLN